MTEREKQIVRELTQKYMPRMRESEGAERSYWEGYLSGISAVWAELERKEVRNG